MGNVQGRLEDKVAIITGAGTGIGEAIAHKFVREGAKVVLCGRPGDPVEDVAATLRDMGGEAIACVGDVANDEHAKYCIDMAIEKFDKLDVLINNAGVFPTTAETQDFPLDAFEELLHNNIRSVFLMTKHALPHLQKSRGCVISAGSESGVVGLAQATPYGGTKGWIHSFMRGVAVEQAKYGVRANCVCPGPIDTAWTHKETGPMDKKMEKALIQATPLGRRGTPEEMANIYAFLASDEASYVTGALWLADGGTTIAKGPVGDEVPDELREEPVGILDLEHSLDGGNN